MKLENMNLQSGDIVTLKNGRSIIIKRNDYLDLERLEEDIKKIERPIKYETIYEKEILDDVEKEYLRNVIKPFRRRIISIIKMSDCLGEYIKVNVADMKNEHYDEIDFPFFKENEMYRGMEVYREYTLKELGL